MEMVMKRMMGTEEVKVQEKKTKKPAEFVVRKKPLTVGRIRQTLLNRTYYDNVSLVLKHRQTGWDVNKILGKGGVTRAHFFAKLGCPNTTNLMIDLGADINHKRDDGKTVLIVAAEGGHDLLAKKMVERGADLNLKDNKGVTALMAAVLKGHLPVVQILLDAGADVSLTDPQGRTALDLALASNQKKIVRLFAPSSSSSSSSASASQ